MLRRPILFTVSVTFSEPHVVTSIKSDGGWFRGEEWEFVLRHTVNRTLEDETDDVLTGF